MMRLIQKSICGFGLFKEPNLQYCTGSAREAGKQKRRQKPRERRSLEVKLIAAENIFYAEGGRVFDWGCGCELLKMVAVVSVAVSKERLPSPSTTSRMLKMTCSIVNLGGNTSPLRRFASEVEDTL